MQKGSIRNGQPRKYSNTALSILPVLPAVTTHNLNMSKEEMTLPQEWYTISASGILRLWIARRQRHSRSSHGHFWQSPPCFLRSMPYTRTMPLVSCNAFVALVLHLQLARVASNLA